MKRISVLFGAGASAFSEPSGAATPPLGENLYDALRDAGLFPQLINSECRAVFEENGFEAGMLKLSELTNRDYNPLLKATAKYLASFQPTSENLYLRFIEKIKKRSNKVTVGTLNYDNLIELSSVRAGVERSYNYQKKGQSLSLLKLHGSCGFLPDLGGVNIQGVTISNCQTDIEAPVRFEIDPTEITNTFAKDITDSIPPAMAMYAKGKRVVACKEEIDRQRSEWWRAVNESEICYLVGVRYTADDAHLWRPLFESSCRIAVVNPAPSEILKAAEAANRKYCFHSHDTFEEFVEDFRI